MLHLGWLFPFLLLGHVNTQDPNCDYVQNVAPGRTYYVASPNYPNNYSAGVQCRWITVCPAGYNCVIECPVIMIPQSNSCSEDRLLVSKTGDPQLTAANVYCGRGSLTAVSTKQRLSIGLISSKSSEGGKFACEVSARLSSNTTTCRCGERKQNRIVGGQETGVNEYKMMAGLADARISQIYCGAVIISNKYALTAAHCLQRQETSNIVLIVGEHNTTTGSDTPAARGYVISRFIIHPQFTESNYDYDIALVETKNIIEFNDNVGPVCLPFKYINTNFTGAKVTALGWGTLFFGGPISNVLMKVDIDVISQPVCRTYISSLTERQLCTYSPGKDACQYDSGGPLLYTDPSSGLLFNIGIISYGRACAGRTPGVNARVTTLLDWIIKSTLYNFCTK